MSVTVAQLGARMHYAVPRILQRAGMLEHFYTDLCATAGWPRLLRAIPRGLRPPALARLLGRIPEGIPAAKVTAFPGFGLEYARRLRASRTASESTAAYLWAGDRFGRLVARSGFGNARCVYGFNTASERMFDAAARQGIRTILEQTIAPRAVEVELLHQAPGVSPEWQQSCEDAHVEEFAARELREWKLADLIVCASEFVREGLVACGADPAKCVVVPYGVESEDGGAATRGTRAGDRRELAVLFVGAVGLRKGIPYLFAAMRELRGQPIRCRVVGGSSLDRKFLARECPENVELVGAVPRSAMSGEYARADVFCLPSLCEGSATAIYEALAAGLPVVTTANSGSIVRDGIEGFVVPPHDAPGIAAALDRLCRDRSLVRGMGAAARERSDYGSLAAYSGRLVGALGAG
jgi:glycosyltransferase involved in cell wall biosynthesis